MGSFSTSKRLALALLVLGLAVSGVHARRRAAPDPPTSVVAVAYSRATITFTAGADNGSAITSYTATSSPGGLTGTANVAYSQTPAVHVEGLTPGQAYTFTVTATNADGTSVASAASNSVTPDALLVPAIYMHADEYETAGAGTIPARATRCAEFAAADYGNGTLPAAAAIQAAVDACTAGQTVYLGPGVYQVNDSIYMKSNVTLRGAGTAAALGTTAATILYKSNALGRPPPLAPSEPEQLVTIGPSGTATTNTASAVNLTVDAAKGATSVTVTDASAFTAGMIVKIDADEYTSSVWGALPHRIAGASLITLYQDRLWWAIKCTPNADLWPAATTDPPAPAGDGTNDCVVGDATTVSPGWPNRQGSVPIPAGLTWHSRSGRLTAEIHEIASVVQDGVGGAADIITFTTPLHISYPTAKTSQVVRYIGATNEHVLAAGVEDMTMMGGSEGGMTFHAAAYSWAKNIEVTNFGGVGVEFKESYACTLRDSYIHDNHHPYPGGGGYVSGFNTGSSELLIENNIFTSGNKVIVGRASGAGSVVAYNYFDNAYIGSNQGWMEAGVGSSHMGGSHHVLFEGNMAFNYDQDETWGSSTYNVVLRNYLTGDRSGYSETGNPRAGALGFGAWWNAFFGNVLLTPDTTTTIYEDPGDGTYGNTSQVWGLQTPVVWRLGYTSGPNSGQFPDPMVRKTVMRDGNWDYATDSLHWDRTSALTIPDSLYLSEAPDFFDGYTWPWVDADGGTKVFTLPAKVRADTYLAARTAPLAPHINSVAQTGPLEMTVYFAPPYYNGGDVIDNYTITVQPGGATFTRSGPTAKNDEFPITGLSLDTEYTFRVTAANSFGTSPSSDASTPLTLVTDPLPTSDIARVQYAYAATVASVNPLQATFSSNVTSGNLIVVFTRTIVSPPNALLTVTGSNGTFTSHLRPASSAPQMSIWSAVATATGPYTVTCSFNTAATTEFCFAIEYEPGSGASWSTDPGVRYFADFDNHNSFTLNIASPAISTISGGVLVFAASQPPPAVFTVGPGFTLLTGTINDGGSNFGGVQELIADDPISAFVAEMESTAVTTGRYMYGFFNTTPGGATAPIPPRRLRLRAKVTRTANTP
jgi:hypothetical protein